MKIRLALVALTLLSPVAASAQDGRVQLDILDKLAARASEKQEVTMDSAMISSIGQGFVGRGPQGDAARQVLSKLRGIYVRNFEFDDPKAYSMDDINTMRRQLTTPGWTKIVSNEEKGKNGDWELQEVYFFQPGGKTNGIFIINAEPGELSVVNIVGPIDFAELGALAGFLGIPRVQDLGLAPPPPPPPPPAPAPPRGK
jgi:hypothetical protein